jgi:hypothetical protein
MEVTDMLSMEKTPGALAWLDTEFNLAWQAANQDPAAHLAEYQKLYLDLRQFYSRVEQVLEARFQPAQFRSILAILRSVPSGSLDFIFSAWLDELAGLGLLTGEDVTRYKENDRETPITLIDPVTAGLAV